MKTYKEWEAEMINADPQFYKCTEEVLKRRLYEQHCLNRYDKARKETAKEIFEEIEKLTYRLLNDKDYGVGNMICDIAELKKKYEEVEE